MKNKYKINKKVISTVSANKTENKLSMSDIVVKLNLYQL